ncbi:polysaccharide deacetylase family protein [Actinosynnema sp. NPDC020468]|uniref:polysaccharide deacetylase family protein n=1 Tax=Actinosynnema sp. NPDC020468 TaxID=3154488 RepID=UPI0034003069
MALSGRIVAAVLGVALAAVAAPPASAATGPTGDIVYSARSGGQVLALTFDDGPSPTWTPQLLDLLREQKVRATFCLLGGQVKLYPDLVKRIVADGHALCNHSMYHEDYGAKTPAEVQADLVATNDAIRQAAGNPAVPITYFRAPFASWGAAPQIAAGLGLSSLAWTVDPRDWDGSPSDVLIDRLSAQVYPTAVTLSHDGGGDRGPTLAAYRELIPRWKAAGWSFDLPAVTGGPYPPACTAAAWGRDTSYVGGSRVSFGGRVYQANWWTRVEKPSTAPWVWSDLGPC